MQQTNAPFFEFGGGTRIRSKWSLNTFGAYEFNIVGHFKIARSIYLSRLNFFATTTTTTTTTTTSNNNYY
jgi:hypothetical protein